MKVILKTKEIREMLEKEVKHKLIGDYQLVSSEFRDLEPIEFICEVELNCNPDLKKESPDEVAENEEEYEKEEVIKNER